MVGEDPGNDGVRRWSRPSAAARRLKIIGAEVLLFTAKGQTAAGPEILGVDVERRGAPEGAPSAGDGLRASAVLGGEEGDDGAEDGVRKVADEIAVAVVIPCPFPWPAPVRSTGCALLGCRCRRRLLLLGCGHRLLLLGNICRRRLLLGLGYGRCRRSRLGSRGYRRRRRRLLLPHVWRLDRRRVLGIWDGEFRGSAVVSSAADGDGTGTGEWGAGTGSVGG